MIDADQTMLAILDAARWAPSGDNTQPWRFEVISDRKLIVHGHDTRDHCVYDLEGEASQISLGCLLETMDIAASEFGWAMHLQRQAQHPPERPTFEVAFDAAAGVPPSPLIDSIRRRSVQRRPLSTRALTQGEKTTLEAALGADHSVRWLEGRAMRWAAAKLMFRNAKLRLTMPEAYQVHSTVIEWGAKHSEDRVPDQALGVDAMTLRLMKHVMVSWDRVRFFNRYLAGTWVPRILMDLIPSLACGAHLVIQAKHTPNGVDDFVAAGRAVQRFWLTATRLGLWQQPEMTPLIFSRYVRKQVGFTQDGKAADAASSLEQDLTRLLGATADRSVWMARIGAGTGPAARSTRLPLKALTLDYGSR